MLVMLRSYLIMNVPRLIVVYSVSVDGRPTGNVLLLRHDRHEPVFM